MQSLRRSADLYVQEEYEEYRTEGVMGEWRNQLQRVGPEINDPPVADGWSGTSFTTPSVAATSSMAMEEDVASLGLGLSLGLELNGCGDGGVSVGGQLALWSFPTPPPTAVSQRLPFQVPHSPPPTANLQALVFPPQHQHLSQHPDDRTDFNALRPRKAPAFGAPALAGATSGPFAPTQHTPVRAAPAFAFAAPELVVEELPETWSSQPCGTSYTVLTSPLVTYPALSQNEFASAPPAPNQDNGWLYTPPATSHATCAVDMTPLCLAPPSHSPMSHSAAVPVHPVPLPSEGAAAAVEPFLGSEARPSLPVPMTSSSPASSPSLSSPRIETPRDLQFLDGLYEIDDNPTYQTWAPGTDLHTRGSLPVRRLESPQGSRQSSSLAAVASASTCTITNNLGTGNDGLSVPTHTHKDINTPTHTPTSFGQLSSSLSSPSNPQHQQLVRRSMGNSQEHTSTFDATTNTPRATQMNMSATTAYQHSPVTSHNALLAGSNSSINNTSPVVSSLNTAAAHSVYPMAAQPSAPVNTSGPFATGHEGASQGSTLPPMTATEPGMASSAYYGAPGVRPYPTQAAVYPQSQAQGYHHLSTQGQYQPQYVEGTSQASNNPHQAFHDSQYTSPTVGYHQPANTVHPAYATGYGHARSDSMGSSWHASDGYDYGRRTSSSNGEGGGRASGKGEPFLLPNEEELPRPAPSYAALIGEALLLAPPPHQLYVSEISESIKARYPFYRQFPSKIYNGVRHQTSMCKAFVKIPRPFGDQSGGARRWGIRSGCQTWFRDGDYHPPVFPGSSGHNKSKGGKKRSTGNSKQLAIGHDPMSPDLSNVNGPSDGPPWDPVRSPLPWLQRFRASRLGSQQVQEQQLVPRTQPPPAQSLVPAQYTQPSAYGMGPAYQHQYYGSGSGDWSAYQQQSAAHYYPSPPEHGSSWRPLPTNFALNDPPMPRHRPALLSSDDSARDDVRSHSRGQPSPGLEGDYQFNQGDYAKRETSTPLSSPPPGADSSDA